MPLNRNFLGQECLFAFQLIVNAPRYEGSHTAFGEAFPTRATPSTLSNVRDFIVDKVRAILAGICDFLLCQSILEYRFASAKLSQSTRILLVTFSRCTIFTRILDSACCQQRELITQLKATPSTLLQREDTLGNAVHGIQFTPSTWKRPSAMFYFVFPGTMVRYKNQKSAPIQRVYLVGTRSSRMDGTKQC